MKPKRLTDEEWANAILPINAQPQLLTVKQAARFLSTSGVQIRLYIKSGLLKAQRLGNKEGEENARKPWRIWKQDLLKFVNGSSNIEINND